MNILHVVNLSGAGGMEHLFAAYLDAAGADNARLHVASKSRVHQAFQGVIARHSRRVHFLKRAAGVPLPRAAALRDWNVRRILRRTAADRVVFWSTLPSPAWEEACRRAGTSMVYYDHGKAWREPPEQARAALQGVDFCVTVSRGGQRILKDRVAYPGPVRVVPNGVRLPDVPVTGRRRHLSDGCLRVGFAGRMVRKKGLAVLLEAMALLRKGGVSCALELAGEGPGLSSYRRQAAALGLEQITRFHGNVRDMAGFYRQLDVLVVPSLTEPFGLVSIEAAACGTPPVVAAVDGLADTVCDGQSGALLDMDGDLADCPPLVEHPEPLPEYVYDARRDCLRTPCPPAPAHIAEVLTGMVRDSERLAAMGEAARELASQRFSLERYARTLTRHLEERT